MRIRHDWKTIVKRAWSVRLMLLAGLLMGVEAALPLVEYWLPIPPFILSIVTIFVVAAAFIARLLVQKNMLGGFPNEPS